MCIEICYLWAIHRYQREVMKSDRTLRLILYNTLGYLIFQWRKRFNPFGFFRISIFTYIDHTQSLMTKWINCICFCFFSFYLFRRHQKIFILLKFDLVRDEKNGGSEKITFCYCDERIGQKYRTKLLMSVTRDKIKVQACIHCNCTLYIFMRIVLCIFSTSRFRTINSSSVVSTDIVFTVYRNAIEK